MKNLVKLLILINFLHGPVVWAAPAPKLLSTSVGLVGDHFVTSREVQIGQYVEQILYSRKKKKKSNGVKPIVVRDKRFPREVSNYLLEYVVYLESKGFTAAQTTDKEFNKARESLFKEVLSSKAWKELQVTSRELTGILRRKLQAKRFIRFRVDSSAIPITDDEAKRYFEENRVKFGDVPYENFSANIKAFLARQQVDRRLQDWFEVLQTKYKVRNFLTEP